MPLHKKCAGGGLLRDVPRIEGILGALREAVTVKFTVKTRLGFDDTETIDALERGSSIYHSYFMQKWRRSLRLKQEAWPGVYDFGEMIGDTSLRSMTERMVLRHTEYPDLASYFSGYAITGGVLESLAAPTALITAADDPMILGRDLARLARPVSLELTVTPRGGHCGYMDALRGPSWIDRRIAFELERD